MEYIVVFITAANDKEAKKIAGYLVRKKLAACVNILNNINSVFFWKDKVENAKELLLIAKTIRKNFKPIVCAVKKLHSYECPEIIALPILDGDADYLKWIHKETGFCV